MISSISVCVRTLNLDCIKEYYCFKKSKLLKFATNMLEYPKFGLENYKMYNQQYFSFIMTLYGTLLDCLSKAIIGKDWIKACIYSIRSKCINNFINLLSTSTFPCKHNSVVHVQNVTLNKEKAMYMGCIDVQMFFLIVGYYVWR